MSLENVHDLVVRGKAKLVPAAVQELSLIHISEPTRH